MNNISIFVIFFTICGRCLYCQTQPTSRTNSLSDADSCLPLVRDYVLANYIQDEELVLPYKAHDVRMEICYDGASQNVTSCCTHKLEKRFRGAVDRQIHELIQKRNSELKNLISRNIAVYQDEIVTMIKSAEQKTHQLFTGTYHMGTKGQTAELSRFFNDLIDLYDSPDGSVRVFASTSRFFNQLFPLVFHNILNDPTAVELTEEYRKCLIRARNEVQPQPFGQAPQKVSTELSQAVSSSYLFLQALRTAVETLNVTDSLFLDGHCSRALVRMQHCAICQKQEAKPCRNLCLNVMRGCLAKLQHLEDPWNTFVDSLNLFNAEEGTTSISKQHQAYQSIHTRISESIMHAMETTHKFYNKVTAKCGNPQTSKGAPTPRQTPPSVEATAPPADLHHQGRRLRKFLFTTLTESKGFFGNLADGLCDEKEFAAPVSHGKCWNGQAVAAYEEPVKGKSLEDQTQNPEVKVKIQADPQIVRFIDKKNELVERITSQMGSSPQDDYPIYSGDGARTKYQYKNNQKDKYNYWNQYIVKQWSGDGSDGDDEDLGSGSGGGPYSGIPDDDNIYIDSPYNRNNNNNNNNNPPRYRNNNNNNNNNQNQDRNDNIQTSVGSKKKQYGDSAVTASHSSILFSTALLLAITLWLNG